MEKFKVGVVGLGHRGRAMIMLVKQYFPCAEVTAACEIDPVLWHEVQWGQVLPMKDLLDGARYYEDYDTMLANEKLDLVMVETGADVHAEFCIKALARDINVFSDIPSVATLDEADRLWKAEQASKGQVMTGANPNEWGFANALVDLYNKGLLGEPYYMEAEYLHCTFNRKYNTHIMAHSPWRKTLPPIRYCTHSLGPLLRIVKEDLRYAICVGTGSHIDPNDVRDNMQAAFFQTESGVTIRLLRNGRIEAQIGHHSMRVFGTKGYFERVDQRGKTPPVTRFNSRELYGCSSELAEMPVNTMPLEYIGKGDVEKAGHGGVDYALIDHMFLAMQAGEPMPISLREGLRMTLPGIYAAESAVRKGERLTMHYPWEAEFQQDIAKYEK